MLDDRLRRGSAAVIRLEDHPDGIVLPVKAQPGARRQGIAGIHAGALKVQVTQVAERGKATDAVLETVAEALQLKRSQVTLLAGATSREKRLLISGIATAELNQRLEQALPS